jgi:hypothetical protein
LKTVPHPVLQLELPPKLVVGVRWALVHFVSAVLILGSVAAFGQSQRPADPEISPYLVRVQRATPGKYDCQARLSTIRCSAYLLMVQTYHYCQYQ